MFGLLRFREVYWYFICRTSSEELKNESDENIVPTVNKIGPCKQYVKLSQPDQVGGECLFNFVCPSLSLFSPERYEVFKWDFSRLQFKIDCLFCEDIQYSTY